jgi:hypothetical protein
MAAVFDLRPYRLKHDGATGWIVGRGKTEFCYKDLADADGPVFFINDAVQLEKYLSDQPSYMTWLDLSVGKTWLARNLRSTVLVPQCAGYYELERGENTVIHWQRRVGYFDKDRDLVAKNNSLMTCWGTITPTIHFAWYTGCKRLKFVGCDGVSRPKGSEYDERLANTSQSVPGGVYAQIKASQERVCHELGLAYVYVGTPREAQREPVRFISFATPKYESEMMILADSAAALGLLTHFEVIADRGGWQANVAYKPEFIRQMQQEYPSDRLVWVDADAEFQQYPALFWDFPETLDFAAHVRGDRQELLSGTLYFGPTKGAVEIVNAWCAAQAENPGMWDQKTLQSVLKPGQWRTDGLPPSYCFIFDTFKQLHPGVEPVIEHHQASRRNR